MCSGSSVFESYYAVCLCFLPWQATYSLQEHLHFLCLNICGTAYPVFKSPKEPSACILRFVLKRIPFSESIRSKSSFLCFRNYFRNLKCLCPFFQRCFAIIPFDAFAFVRASITVLTFINRFFAYISCFCFLSGGL